MRQYTAMFIIRPTLTEEGFKAVIEEITKIFTDREGKVLGVNEGHEGHGL